MPLPVDARTAGKLAHVCGVNFLDIFCRSSRRVAVMRAASTFSDFFTNYLPATFAICQTLSCACSHKDRLVHHLGR